eukprot:3609899-Amphidinium_carterae.1
MSVRSGKHLPWRAPLDWQRTHVHARITGRRRLGELLIHRGLAADEQFEGHVFTDGSAQHPTKKEARVATWAVVQLTQRHGGLHPAYPEYAIKLSAHGVVGTQISTRQAAADGEIYAAVYALEHSAKDAPLH